MDVTTERFLSKCHSTKGFCRISENPADIDKADAILFHNADYSPSAVPKPRKFSRPHVLWSLESPTNDHLRPEPLFPIDRYGRCGKPAPGCDGVDKQGHSCVAQLI
ncbi:hypothetical protein ANCDUO_20571, partial [Ancylostoma duodenale]